MPHFVAVKTNDPDIAANVRFLIANFGKVAIESILTKPSAPIAFVNCVSIWRAPVFGKPGCLVIDIPTVFNCADTINREPRTILAFGDFCLS